MFNQDKLESTWHSTSLHEKGTSQISWKMFYYLLNDVHLDSWPVSKSRQLYHYKDTRIHWTVFASMLLTVTNTILKSGKLQCNNSIKDTEVRWTHWFSVFLPFVPCLTLRTWNLRLSVWRQRAGFCTVFGACSLFSHIFSASSCVSILQPALFVSGSPGSNLDPQVHRWRASGVLAQVSLHAHSHTCTMVEREWVKVEFETTLPCSTFICHAGRGVLQTL